MTEPKTENPTVSIALIDDRESAYFSALEAAVDELAPKVSELEREIARCRDTLHRLKTQPIPADDFGAFLAGYVDAIAAKGSEILSKHLDAEVANVQDNPHNLARRVPLAFDQAVAMMNGRDVPRLVGPCPSPLPVGQGGAIRTEVLMYLFADQIKAKLETLVTHRPVSYGSGGVAGESLAARALLVEAAEAQLHALLEEHERNIGRLAQLRRKLGRRV
ncbi:MAG TPA: hypothetical protein DCL01_12635 [Thauera sp.]|nr:hypothetical protein [Thauera sp.]HHW62448.1 hypothetical protein [Rhodocyclaceae bacterium]